MQICEENKQNEWEETVKLLQQANNKPVSVKCVCMYATQTCQRLLLSLEMYTKKRCFPSAVRESAHLPHGRLVPLGGAEARQQHISAADHGGHAALQGHPAVLHHLDLL